MFLVVWNFGTVADAGPALSINVSASRHAISEDIYGMNYADETLAAELRLPVRRWGGNSTTRYNWQTNMHNSGSDWYFENLSDGNNVTNGSASDIFVEQNRRTGTKTIMTIPLIGWTPRNDSPRNHPLACGFKVSKYGTQVTPPDAPWLAAVDPWDTDCGTGVNSSGNITGNDPADTSTAITSTFVTGWVNHLVGRYGTAANGGVAYYNLDNEPGIWESTHRDVRRTGITYNEIRDLTYQYAAAIKQADPSAFTLGPVQDGWTRYWYASYSQSGIQDRQNHGNTPFVVWYLQQMKAYEDTNHTRILDYLDLHYYPQGNGVYSDNVGDGALRLRSTRSLWDPTYTDESWINGTEGGPAVRLIPRMKEWITSNYPGTKTAISEYNFGALNYLNGALAQADVLGIFGREGLDLATLWGPPTSTQPGAFAFRMYRNYDNAKHGFGDVSVQATSADQSILSVYAAQRTNDNAVTIIVINKTASSQTSSISLAGFTAAATAAVYRYSSVNLNAIEKLSDQAITSSGFDASFSPNSITLFVMMPGNAAVSPPAAPAGLTVR